ncbi:MAG: restriction endonuclease subunit S [Bacteroidota bacterium]
MNNVEWKIKKLNDVTEIASGGTPKRDQEKYWNGNIPWITTSELNFNRIYDSNEYITEAGLKNSSAKYFEKGTVLIALYGQGVTRGKTALLEIDATTNQACAVIDSRDKDEISNEYLFYYLTFSYRKLRHMSNAGGQENLSARLLKGYKIEYPSITEQEKIVDIIQKWDEGIKKLMEIIAAKKRYKKGLMQQLLSGKKRFPEFEGEDWVEVTFGDVFHRITNKNADESISNVLTISAQDGLVSQTEYYNKSVASKDLSNYLVIQKGDFAYNKSYSEGYPLGAIKRLEDYTEGILSPLYICFRIDSPELDSDFMTHFFGYGGIDHEIYKIAREGARNHGLLNVSIKDFLKITFRIPSLKEQKRIAGLLNKVQREIELLEKELDAVKKQKKGLMQKLLTGKVRVHNREEV